MLQIKTYLMFENVVKYAIEGMKFILLCFFWKRKACCTVISFP